MLGPVMTPIVDRPIQRTVGVTRPAMALAAAILAGLGTASVRGEVAVDGTLVKITKADCLRLVKHRPDPGVTYQPGVDVHGDPVAGADLYDRPRIELPERLQIPIEVDLDDRYDFPGDDSFKGDVQVGTVEVDTETGRATFNGQPLTSAAEAALRARCQDVLTGGPDGE